MKVLFLSEWYPHRYDAMAGLFVRKHAQSVARMGDDVCVLYLHKDDKIRVAETEVKRENGIIEIYVYYPDNYMSAARKGMRKMHEEWGVPEVSVLNVVSKNGLLAEYLWRIKHIPYVVIEHWSGYLPQNNSIGKGLHKCYMQRVVADGKVVMPVSATLEDAMKQQGFKAKKWGRIHNVVDDFFFASDRDASIEHDRFELLHVSCFDERAKNVCGLLRAVKMVAEKRQNFKLTLVGTGADIELAKQTALDEGLLSTETGASCKQTAYDTEGSVNKADVAEAIVEFVGEQTPEEVCRYMRNSDAFVLFSNYENAPVVISECLAVGLPIVTSAAGGVPEMINADNGILVKVGDEQELAEKILWMMDHYKEFSADQIRLEADKYSADSVGKMLHKVLAESTL